jgi:hypothetical protein
MPAVVPCTVCLGEKTITQCQQCRAVAAPELRPVPAVVPMRCWGEEGPLPQCQLVPCCAPEKGAEASAGSGC